MLTRRTDSCRRRRSVFSLLIASLIAGASGCDRTPSAASSVDAVFAEWNRRDSPGCGVGVGQHGRVLLERGYGMADVSRAIPITSATVFDVASIAKQFTAMSIMVLAADGKLSLDDEVWKYVPGWANRRDRITIRHLLAHTAGLRDAFLLTELAPPPAPGTDINQRLELLLARQRGLNAAPGTEFSYNNGGYNLLGRIVGYVSGQPLREFARARLFEPLGMTSTLFRDATTRPTSTWTLGYHRRDDDGLDLAPAGGVDRSDIVGNAGVRTTVRDLLTWEHNFAETRIANAWLVEQMQTPVTLSTGDKSPFGLGLEIGEDAGRKTVGHGGGDRGIAAYVIRYPDHDLAVAVFCNFDNLNNVVGTLARRVAAFYLPGGSTSGTQAVEPRRLTLTAAQLQAKTGLYRDATTDTYGRIFLHDGRLMASPDAGEGLGDSVELAPVAPDRFVVPRTPVSVEFVSETSDAPQQLRVSGAGPRTDVLERVPVGFEPSVRELQAFAGRYLNEDLDTTYTVTVSDGRLAVEIPGRNPITLTPIFRDAFYGSLVDVIRFARGQSGPVTALTINRATVRNLEFTRVP